MSAGLFGCGGVLFEQEGVLKEAFTCGIKAKSSLEAELWGCLCGLRRAWNLDIRNCRIWTDSMEVLDLINLDDFDRHESWAIIQEIKLMLVKDWRVQIVWRSREENMYADHFAKQALCLGPGLRIWTREEAANMLALDGVT